MDNHNYWNRNRFEDFEVDQFFQHEQNQERERLEQELKRVETLLNERTQIHSDAVEELESKLDWYIERLEDLYRGVTRDDSKIDDVKARIEGFYAELRSEKRNHWRDKIDLEMELRRIERSLHELDDDSILDLL